MTNRNPFAPLSAVLLGSILFAAMSAPISAQTIIAITNYRGTWAANTNYGVGAIVTWDGLDYICIAANTSGGINTSSPAVNAADWQIFAPGVQVQGTNTSAGSAALNVANSVYSDNTAFGHGAMGGAFGGSSNTAVGSGALNTGNGASNNVAIGYRALHSPTAATGTVAIGWNSLTSFGSGLGNVAIGDDAFQGLQSGQRNIAVGFAAGGTLASGSNNVYVANASPGGSESNTIRIGTMGTHTSTFVAGIGNYNILSSDDPNLPVFVDTVTGQLGTGKLLAGPTGPQGIQGIQGIPGPMGSTGPMGPAGVAGAQGAAGPAGATGAMGPQGSAGATGAQGVQGIPGPAGANGAAGAQGPAGPQGPNGANGVFNYQGAWIATTPYPADAVVSEKGSSYVTPIGSTGIDPSTDTSGTWMILALAGVPGTPGAAGPAGPQGVAGPIGPAGATGATGAPGPVGANGTAGAQGPAGAQGLQGLTGATGATGAQGPAGPQGPAGTGSGTFNYVGPYVSSMGYNMNDVVTFQGSLYRASSAIFGFNPSTNPSFWSPVTNGVLTDVNLNTAAGVSAFVANTTGTNNTAYGENALFSNTTGYSNSATGQNALYSNTTGFFNIANGSAALYYNTTGANNTADGEGAMYVNSSGNNNTAVGQNALRNSTTGSGNIALGYLAGTGLQNGSNNIYVGNQGVDGVSGTIWIGSLGTHTNAYFAGITASLSSDAAALPVFIDTTTGQLGLGAVQAGPAGPAGPDGATGAMGPQGIRGLDGSPGLPGATGPAGPVGPIGPTGTTGPQGPQGPTGPAGAGFNFIGQYNSASFYNQNAVVNYHGSAYIAFSAIPSGVTPPANPGSWGEIANGVFSDSYSNTASGSGALVSVTPISGLFESGGQFNSAFGNQALAANTTGFDNQAFGYKALGSNTTGAYNSAFGILALGSATGSNNIGIGASGGADIASGDNNIDIGNPGVAGESNTIRIGLGGVYDGFVPQTAVYIAGINGVTTNLAGSAVLVDANGQLGTISSSRRYKEDIQAMADASDRLLQLRPVQFRYKKPNANGEKPIQYGLIAEDVAQVLPELVISNKDGQPETVAYHLLPAMLLNELQKEHAMNEQHTEQLTEQEKIIHDQAAQIAEENEKIVAMQSKVSEVQALKARLADLERVTTLLAKMNGGGGDGVTVHNVAQRAVDSAAVEVH